ncbi:branched-chain amino acid aminotransferase [Pseudogymnoascus sp. 23342-1-I1]|nr:branched-chain amino acid aminotransferase [Pseudogymnoascus sp. 23342-1-I1]
MVFPPPPVDTIDWNDIGFKVREVNGHIECHYSKKTGEWTAPKFVTDPFLRIHGMAPGLNYGQQAYEGLKAFRTPNNTIQIFRPSKNALRMQHSADFISIPQIPENVFVEAVHAAVALNAAHVPPFETGAAMYIRPLVFGSSAQLGLSPPEEYTFCVYVLPVGVYHGVHPVKALILEDFDRSAPEGTGSAKVGGNYAPVLRHSDKARNEGFGITLHLDSQTRSEIDEFSTSGFIGVRTEGDKTTIAVPDSKNVIASVTADSVLEIAKSLGYTVESRSIKYEELPTFTEVIAAGTAAALVPIRSITRRSRDDTFPYIAEETEEPGAVFTKLLTTLQDIQRGKAEDPYGWCELVKEPEAGKSHGDGQPKTSSQTSSEDALNDDLAEMKNSSSTMVDFSSTTITDEDTGCCSQSQVDEHDAFLKAQINVAWEMFLVSLRGYDISPNPKEEMEELIQSLEGWIPMGVWFELWKRFLVSSGASGVSCFCTGGVMVTDLLKFVDAKNFEEEHLAILVCLPDWIKEWMENILKN